VRIYSAVELFCEKPVDMARFMLYYETISETQLGGEPMARACNEHIDEALEMARRLLVLSDVGDLDREDDGCGVLYGVVRDCAYKIRAQAEREREAHRRKGI